MVTTGTRGKPGWFDTGFTPVENKGDFLHVVGVGEVHYRESGRRSNSGVLRSVFWVNITPKAAEVLGVVNLVGQGHVELGGGQHGTESQQTGK